MARGQNTSLTFSDTSSPKYVYFVTTNDYPVRPINTTWNVSSVAITRVTFAMRMIATVVLLVVVVV
jgi:hypothetical protein